MSVPAKYRAIGDFHEYYSGKSVAPYLTLFAGGNHEASNHLWELFYGGWVAPNIYYLGAANVVNLGPLRIAGLSGIWAGPDYRKPHFERLPYDMNELKSAYHVREFDTRKLLQIRHQVDVGISHDWPWKVEWEGDWKQLFRFKPHFESDAKSGRLGSRAARYLMDRLRPRYWFAAHLHCKYSAVVSYDQEANSNSEKMDVEKMPSSDRAQEVQKTHEIDLDDNMDRSRQREGPDSSADIRNDDEIDLDMDDDAPIVSKPTLAPKPLTQDSGATLGEKNEVSAELRDQLPAAFSRPISAPTPTLTHPETITNKTTHFLSLDKCLLRRKFLQLLDVDPVSTSSDSSPSQDSRLAYDKEWLAITRVFRSINPLTSPIPRDAGEAHYRPLIEAEEAWVQENLVSTNKMAIPENFEITAPVYDPSVGLHPTEHPREYTNPQTVAFCEMLGIENFFTATEEEREARRTDAEPISKDGRSRGNFRGRGRGFGGRGGDGGRGRGRGRGRGFR
ncbi:MAG: hypothetical protein Q9170_001036 [Blastenia crenularia]